MLALGACSDTKQSAGAKNETTESILKVVNDATEAVNDAKSIDELKKISENESTSIEKILESLTPEKRDSFMADTIEAGKIDSLRADLVSKLEAKARELGSTME